MAALTATLNSMGAGNHFWGVRFVVAAQLAMGCGGLAVIDGSASAGGAGGSSLTHGGASNGGSSGGNSAGSEANACAPVMQNYAALAARLTADTQACTTRSDCMYLDISECGNDCSYAIVNTSFGPDIGAELDKYAQTNCTACGFGHLPCPSRPNGPLCINGQCNLGEPL